jgi:hypothetical protein
MRLHMAATVPLGTMYAFAEMDQSAGEVRMILLRLDVMMMLTTVRI